PARGAHLATACGEAAATAKGLGALAVDRVRPLLERGGEPRKRGVEHCAHQHRQHAALELVGEVEADVALGFGLWLEDPAVFETGEWSPQIPCRYLQIGPVEHDFAGEGLPH